MANTFKYRYPARCVEIGKRIRAERARFSLTQAELAAKLSAIIDKDQNYQMKQSTIASWETGQNLPPLDRLIALAVIFKCDIGYLLCDYDERTKEASDVCKITGLSESSVGTLTTLNTFGDNDIQKVIDILINDVACVNVALDGRAYRSVLNLLYFYLYYAPSDFCNQIDIRGNITAYNGSYLGKSGYIASDSIQIDEQIVENAVMLEIQKALFSIKENLKNKSPHEKEISETTINETSEKKHITVAEWLDIWISEVCHTVKEGTIKNYKKSIKNHIVPAIGDTQLRELTCDKLDEFYKKLQAAGRTIPKRDSTGKIIKNSLGKSAQEQRPLAKGTVSNVKTVLNKALSLALSSGYIDLNPAYQTQRTRQEANHVQEE